jgi:hypothetical protein
VIIVITTVKEDYMDYLIEKVAGVFVIAGLIAATVCIVILTCHLLVLVFRSGF